MPYQLKRSHPVLFSKLVDLQADFTNQMVIAVEGIPVEHMYCGFRNILQTEFPAITAIYEHKNTRVESEDGPMIGRWNLMCSTAQFDSTACTLKSKIGTLYENYMQAGNRPVLPHQYFPSVTSNIRSYVLDDVSDITRNSFASFYESSSIASYNKESPEDPYEHVTPSVFGIAPEASTPTVTYAEATKQPASTPTTVSEITLPSHATISIQSRMEAMQKQMESLQSQLAQMAAQLSMSHLQVLPSAPSSPRPYPPAVLRTNLESPPNVKRPSPNTTLPSKKRNDQRNTPTRRNTAHHE